MSIILGHGSYTGAPGFDRGYQTTTYGGNDPESWVRGSARLDTQSTMLEFDMQLETDSVDAGPKGKLKVIIRDAAGHELASAETQEVGIGGKTPGNSKIVTFKSSIPLSNTVCQKANDIEVFASCTGYVNKFWGLISPDDIMKIVNIIINL